ncbi:MAG: hypothetical protein U5L45_03210 [Saprospiraceae bacterium]|nr:hypothetical protein [Saprospiraceae bacterium]
MVHSSAKPKNEPDFPLLRAKRAIKLNSYFFSKKISAIMHLAEPPP